MEAMTDALPLSGPISIDGGVSGSPYFVGFLASLLDRPVVVRGLSEQTSLGIATLAALGIGHELASSSTADVRYTPTFEVTAPERTTYADAVARSRGWRR
jgi:glycerol kinase